jgi:hypothetical protein
MELSSTIIFFVVFSHFSKLIITITFMGYLETKKEFLLCAFLPFYITFRLIIDKYKDIKDSWDMLE